MNLLLKDIQEHVDYQVKVGRYYLFLAIGRLEEICIRYDQDNIPLEVIFTHFHQLKPRIEGKFFVLSWEST